MASILRLRRILSALALLCATWPLSGAAADALEVRFPWQAAWVQRFSEQEARGELSAWLFQPSTSPAPYVIFLHGCNGLNLRTARQWADFYTAHGVGVLMVDSFKPRGVANTCGEGGQWLARRADDASSALNWLRGQPFARRDRIAVMGLSQGGGVALLILNDRSPSAGGFVGGVALYPGCAIGLKARLQYSRPLLVQVGDQDNWTPAADCEALKAVQGEKSRLELTVYPGARHAFDSPVRDTVVLGKYLVGEHIPSRDRARARVEKFIAEELRPVLEKKAD